MNKNLEKVIEKIKEIEDKYDVTILSRGGSYGSSKLIIRDNTTGEEIEYDY